MTQPDEYGFANRAQDLMLNHPYLDHQTVAALAQQPTNPQQTQANGQTVAQAIAQTWDGFEQTWSDPVLQSQPTLQTGIGQYIKDTIGAPPIDAGTITALQTALQKDGLGAGLPTDGAWTPDWQAQYNQALTAAKSDQFAGQKPGSVKTSTGLKGFLGHLSVTGALDSIVGYVKSIPNDARVAAGDVAGALAGIGHVVSHPSEITGNSKAEQETIASVNSAVQNALGGNTNKAQQVQAESWGGQLNALNDALSLAIVTGIGKKAAIDIGENIAKGTLEKGAPELVRQPGVISKTLFNGSGNGRLFGSKFVGNLPGIARVTPMVGKLAGSDGWYYGARTYLAQPYKYAAARAAGQAFSRTQVLGLGLYGDALAASKLPGNGEAQSVLNEHVLDAIDHNITQYGPRIFGVSPLDINNLALFLHGPIGAGTKGSASSAVGQQVQDYLDGFTSALGEKGIPAAFQQATGMSRQDWLKAADGDSQFLAAYMTSKVNGYAEDWYADRQLGAQLNGAQATQWEKLQAAKTQYRALTTDEKAGVVRDMLASDPSMAYLTTRVKADIARAATDPSKAAANSLSEFKTGTEKMQALHKKGVLAYLMSPKDQATLGDLNPFGSANVRPDFGSAAHLHELNPNLTQDLGLARNETLTRNQVLDPGGLADKFDAALEAAGDDPLAQNQVADQVTDFLHNHLDQDAKKLGVYGATGNAKRGIQLLRDLAEHLASDVTPTYDIPEAFMRDLQDLNTAGYKIVVGDHLGDFYQGNLPDVGANNGWLTGMRKWAGKSGVDPTRVPDDSVARATRQGMVDELARTIAGDSRVAMRPYQTPATVLAMLSDEGGVQKSLPWYARAIFHGASRVGANKTEIEFAQQTIPGLDSEQAARAELEQRLASGLGPRDTSRKAIIDALTNDHLVRATSADGSVHEWTWEAVDEKTANLLYRAIQRGYRQPGYIMGWQAIENWARAGHGFPMAGVLTKRYPGVSLFQAVANWPNRVAQVRNRLRFTASFVYDTRRWTKQAVKMVAEGVEPTLDPLQTLMDEGAAISAQKLFHKVGGRADLQDQLDADRMLAQRSVYGIYSPAWTGAYFIHRLKQAGKTDTEVKDAYNRVFKYGTGGGTSPLERSANTVFFPFSFEKTLLRNLGGYLLDRPAQALALDLAVDEWRKADKNSAIGQFVEDHFPILWEMNALNNAFTHGISPGELGGINAPIIAGVVGAGEHAKQAVTTPSAGQKSAALLNLFLPQDWGANLTPKNLSRYLPVWNQFATLWHDAAQQGQIAENAMYNVAAKATKSSARRPVISSDAQQRYGTREKVKLVDALQPVLDYNAKHDDDAAKIKWLDTDPAAVRAQINGQPINKSTIGQYAQTMYPAYDPNSGTAFAEAQQRAEANFISQMTAADPAKGQQMASFAKLANTVIGKINRDQYEPAQMAQLQNLFQSLARNASRTDPDWLKFYQSFFSYALGPVTSPSGKAAA